MTVKCSVSLPKLRPDVSARETRIALVRSNPGNLTDVLPSTRHPGALLQAQTSDPQAS